MQYVFVDNRAWDVGWLPADEAKVTAHANEWGRNAEFIVEHLKERGYVNFGAYSVRKAN